MNHEKYFSDYQKKEARAQLVMFAHSAILGLAMTLTIIIYMLYV